MDQQATDIKFMKTALQLAEKGRGFVAPNPLVGCVIVSGNGKIIGKGWHERYGQAHAEINALASVKNKAELEGATVYVSLEPCAHQGKTPPCAVELAKWPIDRVVYATADPNPKVNGKGGKIIRDAGIKISQGILEKEARLQNEFFFHHITTGKPFITLKMAQTLDGYLAAQNGESQWVSSLESRSKVHQWRSWYDAVMIGRETALIDNPKLSVRHVEGRNPKRIVIDGNADLPTSLHLFSDDLEEKTIRIVKKGRPGASESDPILQLLSPNYFRGQTIEVGEVDGHSDLREAILKLGEMQVSSIMVEAGNSLASALIRHNLVDKLHLFIAPKILGSGVRSWYFSDIKRMSEILELKNPSWSPSGPDILFTGYF